MWIDVKIPYEPNKQLALAYNRAMENTIAEWVLLLDHDVSLVNPRWYEVCLKAIEELKGTNAGLITCVTSGKARSFQIVAKENSDHLNSHISIAEDVYKKHKYHPVPVVTSITGFFMLINKEAWSKVKFRGMGHGVDKVDIDFSTRLLQQGYKIYVILGLYVYHRRELRNINFPL